MSSLSVEMKRSDCRGIELDARSVVVIVDLILSSLLLIEFLGLLLKQLPDRYDPRYKKWKRLSSNCRHLLEQFSLHTEEIDSENNLLIEQFCMR